MCRLALWLYLITLGSGVPDDYQYCGLRYRRLCQGKGYHIACRFPEPGPSSSCARYTKIEFTNELRRFITHYINRRRQNVAVGKERVRGGVYLPKPRIMMLVSWDRELAQLAQRLADQCSFVHDNCRATVRYPYPGQTVGEVRWRRYHDSVALSVQRAIRRVFNAWWGEKRRVRASQLISPFKFDTKGAVWGHFSQLAVWNLQAVGCGAVRHGALYPRLLLVCDYSHTNMLGQRTLVPGKMEQCPLHMTRRHRSLYPLLCGPVHPAILEPTDIYQYEYYDDEEPMETMTSSITDKTSDFQDTTIIDTTVAVVGTEKVNDDTDFYKTRPILPIENQSNEDQSDTENRYFEPVGINNQLNRGEEWRNVEDNQLYDLELIPRPTLDDRHIGSGDRFHKIYKENKAEIIDMSRGKPRTGNYWQRLLTKQPILESDDKEDVPMSSNVRVMVGEGSAVYLSTNLKYGPTEMSPRQRWQIPRSRPTRPGAYALLHTPPGKLIKRPFIESLKLDKEDIDQLFKDTGFSFQWVKNDNNR